MKRLLLAVLLGISCTAAALAADQALRVRGTIASLDGHTLSVTTAGGSTVKVVLADGYRVGQTAKADLSKIEPGTFIGTTAVPLPDGTLKALEVHIFPPDQRGRGEGFRPWDLTPNSTMTNATVDTIGATSVDGGQGRILDLKYQGGEKKVVVPPNVPIVMNLPGDKSLLVAGAHVVVNAAKHDDGSIGATSVIVGKDGSVPPM